jgi:hypothetical protein
VANGGKGGFATGLGDLLIPDTMGKMENLRQSRIDNQMKNDQQSQIAGIFGGLDPKLGFNLPSLTNAGRAPVTPFKGLPATEFNNAVTPTQIPQTDMRGAPNDVLGQLLKVPAIAKEMAVTKLQNALAPPTWHDIPQGGSGVMVDKNGNVIKTIAGNAPKADLVTLGKPGTPPVSLNMSNPSDAAKLPLYQAQGYSEVKTPAAVVNMNNTQEGKFDQTMGEGLAKEYMSIQNGGRSAADASSRLDYLGNLLTNVDTGTGAPTITAIKAGAKRLGMDLDALGVKDDVGPAQAAQVITNQMALDLRSTANGGGMPGAMSDSDRKFLQQMPPGIEKTPEGNKLIIQYWKAMKQREAQVAGWARDYKKQNKGTYDEGFYDYAAQKSAQHPLFSPQGGVPPPAPPPAPQVSKPDYSQLPPGAKVNPDGTVTGASGKPLVWRP